MDRTVGVLTEQHTFLLVVVVVVVVVVVGGGGGGGGGAAAGLISSNVHPDLERRVNSVRI